MLAHRRLVLAALAACALPLRAQSQTRTLEAFDNEVFPLLDGWFRRQEQSDLIDLAYYLEVENGALSDVALSAQSAAGDRPIHVQPDGRLEPPAREDLPGLQVIHVTARQGVRYAFQRRFLVRLPLDAPLPLAALAEAIDQANAVIDASSQSRSEPDLLNAALLIGADWGAIERPGMPNAVLALSPDGPSAPIVVAPPSEPGQVVLNRPPTSIRLVAEYPQEPLAVQPYVSVDAPPAFVPAPKP